VRPPLRIPAAARAPDAPAPRLLVVDDDEHTRVLLRDLCEASGYRVAVACDGEEALGRLAEGEVDLVLLDVMLPKKDGFAVLAELRGLPGGRELPVILCTAMGDMDGKIRGMELGADDYVTKPFRVVELQARIQSALQVREVRRRLTAAEAELAQLRTVDPLTGAGTYAQLKASLDAELARASRYGRSLSVLLLGFDDYNGVRYRLGRDHVDGWVSAFAGAVRAELRGADRLFRMESDEFIVLLPETDLPGARALAERLEARISALATPGREGTPVSLPVRVSGASHPGPGVLTAEDLLREAHRVYVRLREAGPQARVFAA
jgi:diguanylate cyclase (GGDEF)-like protein